MVSNEAALPSRDEMMAAIEARSAWVARHYGATQRHAVQEESKLYYRDLDKSLKQAIARRSEPAGSRSDAPQATGRETSLSESRG